MKSKQTPKPTKKDLAWQEKTEKKVQQEKVKLGHKKGKERFDSVLKNVTKNNL